MNHPADPPGFPSRTELLLARARRAQRRGERRQAMVALREAALLAESDPKVWALYGSACFKGNRLEEAERAFGQALYFRTRARDVGRARALRTMLARLGMACAA